MKPSRLVISILGLVILLSSVAVIYSQGDQLRRDLIQTIEQRAQKDAESDNAKSTPKDLDVLFGKQAEAAGLTMPEVMTIYERAYGVAKQNEPFWKDLLPKAGWALAIILGFLLILQEAVRKAIADLLDKILGRLYKRAAGFKVFQKKALKNYKRALVKKYERFKNPLRPDRLLDMSKIYIPLKIKGYDDTNLINDSEIVERFKRIVVTGAPGSGKSMLLNRMALSYAVKNVDTNEKIPVLVDLRRFNEGSKSLIDHLVAMLELNDFPNAGAFIQASLGQGNLLLLLDGLDEVTNVKVDGEPTKRATVVREIIDLLDRYENCSAIITCRTAVYRRDFDEIAEQTLEIVEFSDQQIQNFLMSWPDPPADKPIEQLLASLNDRPAILALARNPLLLTIVAFLYTELAEFVLPYSRTDFYTRAVNELQQLKERLNQYPLAPKQLVLEHLALFNQEKDPNSADRLTIDDQTVIQKVIELLPSLNLESKDVRPLINDIVQRSNLLLEVDNKTKYQFFHLTLQEFFAAKALQNDPKKLLQHFTANKDAWRETVKLWCGLPHDSTELIKEVFTIDPLTAFECLADAPKVDQLTADAIIDHYKLLLGQPNDQRDAITKAFAGVSAGRGQRGSAVLAFLVDTLNKSQELEVRKSAAEALALSNKQDAVKSLSDRYDSDPEVVHAAIIRMGDIAIPSLKRLAENGHRSAITALQAIGTSRALTALVPLLWHEDGTIQTLTALKLANMISQKNSFASLQSYSLNGRETKLPSYDWVWSGFSNSESQAMIMGRIGFLLDQLDPDVDYRIFDADWRLIVPLAVKECETSGTNFNVIFRRLPSENFAHIIKFYEFTAKPYGIRDPGDRGGIRHSATGPEVIEYLESLGEALNRYSPASRNVSADPILRLLRVNKKLSFLLRLMPAGAQLLFIPCLTNATQPSLDHWKHIMRPRRPLGLFWPYTLVLVLAFILSGISVLEIITTLQASVLSGRGVISLYLGVSLIGGWSIIGFGLIDEGGEYFGFGNVGWASISFIYPYMLFEVISDAIKFGPDLSDVLLSVQLFISTGFIVAITVIPTLHLLRYLSWIAVLGTWVAIVIFLVIAILVTSRHINRYNNPLRQYFQKVQRA
jgi:hypothetical protein